jgi:stage III sporulation protein AE
MKKLFIIVVTVMILAIPVNAMEVRPPDTPESGRDLMPKEPETFGEGLIYILKEAVALLQPSVTAASGVCLSLIASAILIGIVKILPASNEQLAELVGTIVAAALLIQPTGALIHSGMDTVSELSNYGKLLIPVLTAALAAQGGISSSTALYAGTVAFDAVLSGLISTLILPGVYIFLALAVASGAMDQQFLQRCKSFIKWLITWGLKIILYIFTGYIGITGVVSGSVDSAALKATKLTISGIVPVVGGILSDASEAVLVSAGVMKNAAGVYGLLAIIAVWIGPFIEIGVQYLLLKMTGALCETFQAKKIKSLVQDFSSAMGFLLAMTGAQCLLLMISAVCFMKGVS